MVFWGESGFLFKFYKTSMLVTTVCNNMNNNWLKRYKLSTAKTGKIYCPQWQIIYTSQKFIK